MKKLPKNFFGSFWRTIFLNVSGIFLLSQTPGTPIATRNVLWGYFGSMGGELYEERKGLCPLTPRAKALTGERENATRREPAPAAVGGGAFSSVDRNQRASQGVFVNNLLTMLLLTNCSQTFPYDRLYVPACQSLKFGFSGVLFMVGIFAHKTAPAPSRGEGGGLSPLLHWA